MGRTFYPRISKYVEASAPHPEGTQYKVSVGDEDWDGQYYSVVKVQMVYDGKVAGRKSPSYPVDSNDHSRVMLAISELKDEQEREKNGVVKIPAHFSIRIPAEEYVAIVCKIPSGQVTRTADIVAYLCRKHRVMNVTIDFFPCPPFDSMGVDIPYWRVIGAHGFLSDERACSRERKAELLTREGLTIEPAGVGGKSLRVAEYKKHLVDLKRIMPIPTSST